MASHGGGTAGGQLNLLADYVTEAALVSARATMDTVVIGEVRGIPVHVDRKAASARRSRCRLTATRSAHWVFTAWFSGYHDHSCMLNGRDGMRSAHSARHEVTSSSARAPDHSRPASLSDSA